MKIRKKIKEYTLKYPKTLFKVNLYSQLNPSEGWERHHINSEASFEKIFSKKPKLCILLEGNGNKDGKSHHKCHFGLKIISLRSKNENRKFKAWEHDLGTFVGLIESSFAVEHAFDIIKLSKIEKENMGIEDQGEIDFPSDGVLFTELSSLSFSITSFFKKFPHYAEFSNKLLDEYIQIYESERGK